MKIHKFKKIGNARKKVLRMKKLYGYAPKIFRLTKNGKFHFAVVQPTGLKKIRRRK